MLKLDQPKTEEERGRDKCVCMCVCVSYREKKKERQRNRLLEWAREKRMTCIFTYDGGESEYTYRPDETTWKGLQPKGLK